MFSIAVTSCKKQATEPLSQEDNPASALKNNNGNGFGTISAEMVLRWNKAAIDVVTRTQASIPAAPITPMTESRFYAMVNIAMHDALNNIVPKYKTYALLNARDKDADADAAVAQAAYDVIVAFSGKLNLAGSFTPQPVQDYIDALLQQSLNEVGKATAKAKGIALGHLSAQAILTRRANDGVDNVMFAVTEGTQPGQYRFTAPFNAPPYNGLYIFPGWGNVTPFGMTNSSQFRPGPPNAVTSAEYTADFNEVKSLGRYNSNTRTADQTEIAKFWVESSPQAWNRIAVKIVEQKNMKAWQVARLLALLQMSEADAYIGSFETKLHYFTWRPVSAIHLAANDGNPATTADPDWDVVGFDPSGAHDLRYWPTPPIADYSSAHSVAGGAGAELMKNFFGSDNMSFNVASTSYPSTRSFTSLSQAARENSLSRIYVGYHFRQACIVGEQQGKNIGKWIFDHYLNE
ncbi:MAG: phosphoesterase PA-phosphatase [Chitinophagaceae bacterium]|nr:MAG: phosphoesterase PA-phosphatase [Chitinophagaceae bacterium]